MALTKPKAALILVGMFAFSALMFPFGFYGLGIFTFLATFIVALILASRLKKIADKGRLSEHGTADWATIDEFMKVNKNGTEEKGLWIGGGVFRNKSGHLITFAPSGSGKGTSLIIPALLTVPSGSIVVTDPKGENACITAKAQAIGHQQRVFILDPWNEQEKLQASHGIPPSGFNPFDFLRSSGDEMADSCDMISYYLIPANESSDPYWNDKARSVIKLMLLHILTALPKEEQSFWTLYKFLRLDDTEFARLLANMKRNKAFDGMIEAGANDLKSLAMSEKTFASVMSNAQNATRIFESPQLRKSLEKSEFNPFDLANGKSTVYVVIPERYMTSHAAWLRIVIGLCLKAVNSRPNKRVTFILDEFAVLGKMSDVQNAYAYGRGQNIVMWTFMQSIAQLKEIYGPDGMNSFINNSSVLHAFNLRDTFSLEYISKMLGVSTIMKERDTAPRLLMTPDEVASCDRIIAIAENKKYQMMKRHYYQPWWKAYSENEIDTSDRKAIKSGKLKDEWYEYFQEVADPAPRVH
ncbi:type IV secretory system conjugative DNA transfer family protein [Rufibacter sediminis]|uniref:Type IV secretory system conjugative DNA transfer family protein n=1 Tax=Rufibacter sediminis TaxID=2762756 RepID=A0ABR6VUM0_9BACT|nr:type IV secretory system conjugative DNA transfer family protein [Rufibacter sediminis]MBC3540615.1 type IV secretory system conjugative DNA transfer family protein [Rufibacter sediminis]